MPPDSPPRKAKRRFLPNVPGPLYEKIKIYILQGIVDGTFQVNEKLPSEQDLVARFGVARMTVNRALSELTAEGHLVRLPGVGTFVSDAKPLGLSVRIREIRREILARGNAYDCAVMAQEHITPPATVRVLLDIPEREKVFHGIVLHRENGSPAQLEECYIVERFAPGFMAADFRADTIHDLLRSKSDPTEIEQTVEALLAKGISATWMDLPQGTPTLMIRWRVWVGMQIESVSWYTYPGDRYFVADHFKVTEELRFGSGSLK